MKLNTNLCRSHETCKHTLPSGALAITMPSGKLVAYRKQGAATWQWILKGFQFFGKDKTKGG